MDPWDRPRAMATPFDDGIAFSSPFPPIAEYAFLPRCRAAALLAPDGTVEWLCPPRFDASRLFAAILGRGAGGFRFGPVGMGVPAGRRYEPGTNVLGTTWQAASGWAVAPRVADHWRRERGTGSVTAHTRPPSDYDARHVIVRTIRGPVRVGERLLAAASPLDLYAEETRLAHGPTDGQLPPGLHAPPAHQRRYACHPRRSRRASLS
jgi:GH15 family glucan-1,4-alpha-glucosidase